MVERSKSNIKERTGVVTRKRVIVAGLMTGVIAAGSIVGVGAVTNEKAGDPCDPIMDNYCVPGGPGNTYPTLPNKGPNTTVTTPETTVPQTTTPETTVPQTTVPQTTTPETTVPQTTTTLIIHTPQAPPTTVVVPVPEKPLVPHTE